MLDAPPNPFFNAVAAGDLREMDRLFDPGNLFVQPYEGRLPVSALMVAAENGHMQACRWLLSHGASPFDYDGSEKTALHHACRGGNDEIVSWLLDLGCPIDSVCQDNHTPLVDAARKGHTNAALVLVARGANIETGLVEGYTPLLRAALEMQIETAQALIDQGANIQASTMRRENLLHVLASEIGRGRAFSSMDKSIDVHAKIKGAVLLAERAIGLGVDPTAPDANHRFPIDNAASSGSVPMVALLSAKTQLDLAGKAGHRLAATAATQGRVSLLSWLLDRGARPDVSLHSVQSGNLKDEVIALLEAVQLNDYTPCQSHIRGPRRM